MKSNLWVVIPAYREEAVIGSTVESVITLYPNVIVVDDGSDDRTSVEAHRAGATVLIHPVNLGQGAALQTGISFALRRGASHVATFDADGQHRASDIANMMSELSHYNLDVVLGSRFLGIAENLTPSRKLLLKAAVAFTNLTTGLKLTDTHNGLRLFSASAASRIYLQQDGMAHASEILEQIGALRLKCREVPTAVIYTEYSKRKGQSLLNSFRILTDLFLGRLSR